MAEVKIIETMHRILQDARESKKQLENELEDLESRAAMTRSRISSIQAVIDQTSQQLQGMLFPTDDSGPRATTPAAPPPPPRYQEPRQTASPPPPPQYTEYSAPRPTQGSIEMEDLDVIDDEVAAKKFHSSGNVRFNDFRIPQAATIVLREAGVPLHVSEIHQRMEAGGFEFRGQHQLITLAVSLSRAKRFRKVAPGTFDLDPRYLAGQVA